MDDTGEVGRRVHAARLAAGFVAAAGAANRLGKSRTYYGRIENGHVRVPNDVVEAAAAVFRVSVRFLREGVAETPAERLASRIEQILAKHPQEDVDEDAVLRLRIMRVELDIMTARAGARVAGAKPATYVAHENGSRALPVDRMVGYALAFGLRPEFAVLGAGPLRPAEDEKVDFWVRRDDEPIATSGRLDWSWLSSGPSPARTILPLVEARDGMFQLLEGGGLVLPRSLLDLPMSEQHYGLVVRDRKKIKVHVINPSVGNQQLISASANGGVVVESGQGQANYVPSDVLAKRATKNNAERTQLGQRIATISVDW